MGTWHDPDLGRPIAAPLERCAEVLGVDLATVHEAAAKIEPYIRADGTRIWSLMQLERLLRPEVYDRRRGLHRPPTDPGRRGRANPACLKRTKKGELTGPHRRRSIREIPPGRIRPEEVA